jgi:uncharacterized repeat protein (TIGR01451 family)
MTGYAMFDRKRAGRWSSGMGRVALLAAAAGLPATSAYAAGTPAGTNIENTATATYAGPDGAPLSVDSNTVTLRVDELLDVSVASAETGEVGAAPGATNQVLRFTLTNGGNGPEAFLLSAVANAGGDDFDPVLTSLVLDTNGNGAYDAGVDTVYAAGANDPVLQPDTSLTVFVLSTIPAAATNGQRGQIDLHAEAVTGTGAPGTSFAGQGEGGGDAVVGATGAESTDDGIYRVNAATVALTKAASVAGPFGGTGAIPGAVITYTLTATVSGAGTVNNVAVADPIPAGTTYRPGTLTLEGAALTDAADADAGRFTGSGIAVALGSVGAGTSRTITFQVEID